jgi:23S rRNA (guanosine2251-2'-O)-methyltransferase
VPDAVWLTGAHVVTAAMEAGRVRRLVLLAQGHGSEALAQEAFARGIPVERMARAHLDQLVGGDAQGCAALAAPLRTTDLDTVLAALPRQGPALLVALDHLQDPHNLGAIARSADAAGAAALLLPNRRSVGLTAAAERVSAGAMQWLRLAEVHNLSVALQRCKEAGFWVYGSAPDGEVEYTQAEFATRSVLVIGAEEKGLAPLVRRQCDRILRLPMYGRVASLNASVAAALLMYAWAQSVPSGTAH